MTVSEAKQLKELSDRLSIPVLSKISNNSNFF